MAFALDPYSEAPDWLAARLRQDRPQMTDEDIDWYVMAYEHIKGFERRGKNQLFRLYGRSKYEEHIAGLVRQSSPPG